MSAINIDVLVVPDAFMSSVMGFVDTLSVPGTVTAQAMPFRLRTVARTPEVPVGPGGLPLRVDAGLDDPVSPEVVIVPALVISSERWLVGRHPAETAWLRAAYARGALICSACSGSLLLAEAGLLDGRMATSHWALADSFRQLFPRVKLRMDRSLVFAGNDDRLVMSGAAAAWHDLAIYLVARFAGPATAGAVARFFMMRWHAEGQAPYSAFRQVLEHGDAPVLRAQEWLQQAWWTPGAVDGMTKESGLSARTFTRRFRRATGHSPLEYVQHLRIERAKERLEHSLMPVDEIAAAVGYEDASFFRRLFKRTTAMTPADYRRKFRLPEYISNRL